MNDMTQNPIARYLAACLLIGCLSMLTYGLAQADEILVAADKTLVADSALQNSVKKIESVDFLVERLHSRLEKEPDDVKGWVLLARSYHHLERWQAASEALAKASALGYQGTLQAALPKSRVIPSKYSAHRFSAHILSTQNTLTPHSNGITQLLEQTVAPAPAQVGGIER